ncbi:hypothetical protein VK86_14305 [Moellerella wisconsensis]|nr:hypothetical protein VK86_14305 [Moellerella wisconsensis]
MIRLIFMKFKIYFYLLLSILFVIISAYTLGGKSAKKSFEIKRRREESVRLKKTIEVKKEVDNEVRQMEDGGANNELRNSWMRK